MGKDSIRVMSLLNLCMIKVIQSSSDEQLPLGYEDLPQELQDLYQRMKKLLPCKLSHTTVSMNLEIIIATEDRMGYAIREDPDSSTSLIRIPGALSRNVITKKVQVIMGIPYYHTKNQDIVFNMCEILDQMDDSHPPVYMHLGIDHVKQVNDTLLPLSINSSSIS